MTRLLSILLLSLGLFSLEAADVNITNVTHATSVASTDWLLGITNGAGGDSRLIPVSLFPLLSANNTFAGSVNAFSGITSSSATNSGNIQTATLNVTGTTTLGTANVTSLTATQYVNAISLFGGPTNNYDLSKSLQHYITSGAMAITGFLASGSTPGLQPNSRLVVSNSSAANITLSITSPIFADGTNWVGGWSATVTNGTERHFDFTSSTNSAGSMIAYTNVVSEPLPSTATSAGGSPGVGATLTNILVTQTNNAISARVGGTIWVNTVSASNSVASETVLWTNTLPAFSLTNQNDRLMLHAAGTITANGDTKAIAAYLGATKIFDTTGHSFGASADFWTLDIEIIRGASGTAEVINCRFVCQAANYLNVTTATQDLGTALGVKITATCDASGDAFYKSSSVQLWPAP